MKSLVFRTKTEFNQVKKQHVTESPGLLEKNKNTRQYIHSERDALQKAENALKNGFVRQVASLYPERPEMRYISFQTANKLANVMNKYGKGQIVPIESIEKTLTIRKQEIQRLEGEIYRVDHMRGRLQYAKRYLKNFEKHQAIVEKYENNPFLKGKMLISKSAKEEYNSAVIARNSNQNLMKEKGVTGRIDFKKQTHSLAKMESQIPEFKNQIQSQK